MDLATPTIFSLVIYTDGSNEYDIIPFNSIHICENPATGELFLLGDKLRPLKIVEESENLEYLMSLKKENETCKTMNSPTSTTGLTINQENSEIVEQIIKKEVAKPGLIYPYMIKENKVDLIPESNVWINKIDLDEIKRYLKTSKIIGTRRNAVRSLLDKLIGFENMEFMYLGAKKNCSVFPKIVYSTIEKFLEQNVDNEKRPFKYKSLIQRLLSESRQSVKRKILFVSDSESEIEAGEENKSESSEEAERKVFPYMIRDKNKTELLPHSKVFIEKQNLNFINEICEEIDVDEKKLIFFLLTTLLGSENIKYGNIDGSKCIEIPEVVYFTIFNFVNGKLRKACVFWENEYENYIQIIYKFSKDVLSGKSQIENEFAVAISMNESFSQMFETDSSQERVANFRKNMDISLKDVSKMENDYLGNQVCNSGNCVITLGKRKHLYVEEASCEENLKKQKIAQENLEAENSTSDCADQNENQTPVSQRTKFVELEWDNNFSIPPTVDCVFIIDDENAKMNKHKV